MLFFSSFCHILLCLYACALCKARVVYIIFRLNKDRVQNWDSCQCVLLFAELTKSKPFPSSVSANNDGL